MTSIYRDLHGEKGQSLTQLLGHEFKQPGCGKMRSVLEELAKVLNP